MLHHLISSFIFFVLLSGCGYLPASKQARKVVGDKVFVEVIVSLQDPENAVIIKDATRRAVVTQFHAALVNENQAKTKLLVEISGISFTALQYDANGYIIVYRTTVTLKTKRKTLNEDKLYISKGTFDFNIEANAVITNTQRFDAITKASIKALTAFVAQVGAEGAQL